MFELKTFEEVGAEKWDEFVLACANGSVHQTSKWKILQEKVPTRGKVLGFAAVSGKKIEAVCLAVRMQTGFFGTEWFYSGRGPVFDNKQAAEFLIGEATKQLKVKTKALFWRFDPYILQSSENLDTKSLETKPATSDYHPTHTSVISLDGKPEDLLSTLKKKRRYDIRTGLKNFQITQISGQKVGTEQINKFYDLLQKTSARDGFKPHPKKYYVDFLQTLGENSSLWMAEKDNQLAAASITTAFGDTAIYYFAATTDEANLRKLGPAHALLWSIIEQAHAAGLKKIDLLGIAPPDQPNHPYTGITKFKNSFGGQSVAYKKGVEVILRPLGYQIYKLAKAVKK